eukprot:357281-Chlamydomonas_euryale.AAC.22
MKDHSTTVRPAANGCAWQWQWQDLREPCNPARCQCGKHFEHAEAISIPGIWRAPSAAAQ